MPPNPPELPESLSSGKLRWRRRTALLGFFLVVLALVLVFAGYGHPETLPDGTAQVTWSGLVLASFLFGGCAIMFLADSPWTLFQIVLMFGGGILGGIGAEAISEPGTRAGGVGFGFGFAIGAGAAFAATWVLSRFFDLIRHRTFRP